MLGYGEAVLLKNLILMMLCFVDLIGIIAPSPVANNIAAVDPGAEGGHASSTLHGGWWHPICHTRCRGRSQEVSIVLLMLKKTDNIRAVTKSRVAGDFPWLP